MKNRSDSTQDPESPSRTPPGSLPRQLSTKSRTGQPSAAITPIDEGYESIAKTPSRPPKSPSLSKDNHGPRSKIPPAVSERTSSLPKCPLGSQASPSSTSQQGYDAATAAQVAPYQTIEIAPPESQAPSLSDSSPGASPLYQQPTSNRGVGQDKRFDCYDNINIKNTPATSETMLAAERSTSESADQNPTLEVDAAKMLHSEIDAGGMGCQDIDKAVQERKEFYNEIEQSGVVLLRVQSIGDGDNQGKKNISSPKIG